jgi:hypothetical protein
MHVSNGGEFMDATTATLVVGVVGVVGTLLAALGSQWLSNQNAKRVRYEEKLAELLLFIAEVDQWMEIELVEWKNSWYVGSEKIVVHRDTSCPIFQVQALALYLNPKLHLHASNMVKQVTTMMVMPEILGDEIEDNNIIGNSDALKEVESYYQTYQKEREQIHSFARSMFLGKLKRI